MNAERTTSGDKSTFFSSRKWRRIFSITPSRFPSSKQIDEGSAAMFESPNKNAGAFTGTRQGSRFVLDALYQSHRRDDYSWFLKPASVCRNTFVKRKERQGTQSRIPPFPLPFN